MKPVYQQVIDRQKGDCMKAVIASLLEKEMDEVPNFIEFGQKWWTEMNEYLQKNGFKEKCMLWNPNPPTGGKVMEEYSLDALKNYEGVGGYFWASVNSPKYHDTGGTHAVINHKNINIVHDPNPHYKGLESYPKSDVIQYNGILYVTIIEKIKTEQ